MLLIKLFDPAGYENIFYAMIFVPISIIIFICLLIGVMVVLNRKRFVQEVFHHLQKIYPEKENAILFPKETRPCIRKKNKMKGIWACTFLPFSSPK